MARIKEITYSLGKTIQVKAYEPINFHASIKAEVSAKEDLEKAYAEIKKIVVDQIKKDTQEIQDKQTEAENKVKFPFGACSTCGAPLALSKKGDRYCPNAFKNYEGNPHHSKDQLSPAEEKFKKSLK